MATEATITVNTTGEQTSGMATVVFTARGKLPAPSGD
jgi:hypothetical protein